MNPRTALWLLSSLMVACLSAGESGDPCNADGGCASGLVCEGGGRGCDELQCVPGCRTDDDCDEGEVCAEVLCVTCPCPSSCS